MRGVTCQRRDHYTNTLVNPLHNLRVTFGRTERIRLFADGFHRTLFSNPRWNPDGARVCTACVCSQYDVLISCSGHCGFNRHMDWRTAQLDRDMARQIKMRDLRIVPKDWPQNAYFQPRLHNWRRGSKAPALYLNCTNLNTVSIVALATGSRMPLN